VPLPTPERNELCPCLSGRKYKRCCERTVQQARRELNELCPEILEYDMGDAWLSGVSLMVGLGPNPILNHVDQVAQAQRELLDALLDEEPLERDWLREVLYDLVIASDGLRFPDEALRFALHGEWEYDELLGRLLTPDMQKLAFWSVYGMYRMVLNDPDCMAACALATYELAVLAPHETEFWTCVIAATEAELDLEEDELALEGNMEAVDRVMEGLLQGEIELDIPPYAVAYGALYLAHRAIDAVGSYMEAHEGLEELEEVHLEELLFDAAGGLLAATGDEDESESQLESWMLDAFEVEARYFLPVFTEELTEWAVETAGPDSDPELVEAVEELLSILYEPTEAQIWGLGPFLYFAAVTQFMASDQLEQLVRAPELLKEHASEFASEDPELAQHLRWVYDQFAAESN